MNQEEKLQRLADLFRRRSQIDVEIMGIVETPKDSVQLVMQPKTYKLVKGKLEIEGTIKKRKYTKRKKADELPDPIGQRSNCCGKQIIVVGGDEGTNHYECTSCGESCDIETEESKTERLAPKVICKACKNGGHGRHRKDCAKSSGPVAVSKKKFICDDCQNNFTKDADSDGKCPGCGGTNVWPA